MRTDISKPAPEETIPWKLLIAITTLPDIFLRQYYNNNEKPNDYTQDYIPKNMWHCFYLPINTIEFNPLMLVTL
jgi:hypothetical protein